MIAEMEIKGFNPTTGAIFLDPNRNSPRAQEFAEGLRAPMVGQERAVRQVSGLYQTFLAGVNPINRPIGTMLFLGPTDYGKTRVVEAAAEVVIDRSFANCPTLRQCSKFALLDSQRLTNGRVIALSPDARLQTRPHVKNPERSERPGRPENQRSIGWRELSRIERANPGRRIWAARCPGFARTNASGSRDGQIFGAM
jgi:hypothetical protein